MHSAYCSPTVNTHLAKIINYSNKELARPGTSPAWSGVGVWVAWVLGLGCTVLPHCDGWQQLYWRYLAGLYGLKCLKYILLHLILTPRNRWYIKRVLCPSLWCWCRHLCISHGWSWCWHNVGWRGGAAADNVVSGQVSGLSLHQHLGMATITVGIDTSRVYNRCTHTTHNSYSM